MQDLIRKTKKGLYVSEAGVWMDPTGKVDKAIITHMHADHCRYGMGKYIIPADSIEVFKKRIGPENFTAYPYGEPFFINGLKFSFHPAGHVPGSAQIRVERKGEVWVYSGDYKTESDGLSTPFEPVKCHTFITECTFGLPVYRWPTQKEIMGDIKVWWEKNRSQGKISVLQAYSLGKAQRLIKGLEDVQGTIFCHQAVQDMNNAVRRDGHALKRTRPLSNHLKSTDFPGSMVIISPSGFSEHWSKVFKNAEKAIASGWAAVRGAKRRSGVDRGFVLSDHADWPGLLKAVKATGAERIICTHGFQHVFARYLSENGWQGEELQS